MSANDLYRTNPSVINYPGVAAVAIAPDNDTDLAILTRAIWVGGAGDVAVILAVGSDPVTFLGVGAGTLLPIRVSRVLVTGTSATGLVAIW